MIHAMPAAKPNVFNIPASAPFLPVLIDALLGGKLVPGFPATRDPLELAQATLYLPTRRAARLARDVFLDRIAGDAAILPRILAIGDIDEDEFVFADAATADLAAAALDLPPAIAPLERRLLLAELILSWANSPALRGAEGSPLIANTPSAALGLADDLARLIDDMTTRQVSWARLDGLVPEDLDPYWQLSLDFLKIAREYWPARLKELGAVETAERRDRLIEAEAQRLANSKAPVIAAGSTGSMPATAKLLATIARLPHGALVLPGLDIDLDEASWQRIAGDGDDKTHDGAPAAGHAQFAMQALLAALGIDTQCGYTAGADAQGRELLVSEALRPAATTDHWQQRAATKDFAKAADAGTASIAMIQAANAEEEALAIAVALRETLETPGKTAALVTPDRALARRVAAALERWQVAVDDSAGSSLADTPAGVFARLAAEAALERPRAGDAARFAQAPAAAARRRQGCACHGHRHHRAHGAARPTAAAGQRRARPRLCRLPAQPRFDASQRSALAHRRRPLRRRRRADCAARRRARSARSAAQTAPARRACPPPPRGDRGAERGKARHGRRLRRAGRAQAGAGAGRTHRQPVGGGARRRQGRLC